MADAASNSLRDSVLSQFTEYQETLIQIASNLTKLLGRDGTFSASNTTNSPTDAEKKRILSAIVDLREPAFLVDPNNKQRFKSDWIKINDLSQTEDFFTREHILELSTLTDSVLFAVGDRLRTSRSDSNPPVNRSSSTTPPIIPFPSGQQSSQDSPEESTLKAQVDQAIKANTKLRSEAMRLAAGLPPTSYEAFLGYFQRELRDDPAFESVLQEVYSTISTEKDWSKQLEEQARKANDSDDDDDDEPDLEDTKKRLDSLQSREEREEAKTQSAQLRADVLAEASSLSPLSYSDFVAHFQTEIQQDPELAKEIETIYASVATEQGWQEKLTQTTTTQTETDQEQRQAETENSTPSTRSQWEDLLVKNPTLAASIDNYANSAAFISVASKEDREWIIKNILEELTDSQNGYVDLAAAIKNNPEIFDGFASHLFNRIGFFRGQMAIENGKVLLASNLNPNQKRELLRTNADLSNRMGTRAVRLFYSVPKKQLVEKQQKLLESGVQTAREQRELLDVQLALGSVQVYEQQQQPRKRSRIARIIRTIPQASEDNELVESTEPVGTQVFDQIPIESPQSYAEEVETGEIEDGGLLSKIPKLSKPSDKKKEAVSRMQNLRKLADAARLAAANPATWVVGGVGAIGGAAIVGGLLQGAAGATGAGVLGVSGSIAGAIAGGAIGSVVPVIGTGLGAAIGFFAGGAAGGFGSLAIHVGDVSIAQAVGTPILNALGFPSGISLPSGLGAQAASAAGSFAGETVPQLAQTSSAISQTAANALGNAANTTLAGTNTLFNTLPNLSISTPVGTILTGVIGGTAAMSVLAAAVITSAHLLPGSFLLNENEYFTLTKTPSDDFAEDPTPIQYTITLTPKSDADGNPYQIRVSAVTDTLHFISRNPIPSEIKALKRADQTQLDRLSGDVGAGKPAFGEGPIQYTINFTDTAPTEEGVSVPVFDDTLITNTLTITYCVIQADGQCGAEQNFAESASVVFGNPPSAIACITFGPAGEQVAVLEGNKISDEWEPENKAKIISALEFLNNPQYRDFGRLLCGESNQNRITLWRFRTGIYFSGGNSFESDTRPACVDAGTCTQYAGSRSGNNIAMYNLAVAASIEDSRRTITHELSHVIGGNGSILQQFLAAAGNERQICTYRLGGSNIPDGEDFAESIAVFFVHKYYTFSSPNCNVSDMSSSFPLRYQWIRDNLAGGNPPPNSL